MPTGPKGEKRSADVIGNAVKVMRIATGETTEVLTEDGGGKRASAERRYSPAVCTGAIKTRVEGNPDIAHVERQNLTIRMHMWPVHAADKCILKKVRKPRSHGCAVHRLVQLHPCS